MNDMNFTPLVSASFSQRYEGYSQLGKEVSVSPYGDRQV